MWTAPVKVGTALICIEGLRLSHIGCPVCLVFKVGTALLCIEGLRFSHCDSPLCPGFKVGTALIFFEGLGRSLLPFEARSSAMSSEVPSSVLRDGYMLDPLVQPPRPCRGVGTALICIE